MTSQWEPMTVHQPPPYEPELDVIRWIEDFDHGPSRPRRLTCWLIFWRPCPHQENSR
jgi:hypothetical protein